MTLEKTFTARDAKLTAPPYLNEEQRKAWDAYYSVTAKGDYAYFVSTIDEESGREVNEDIFRISLKKDIKPDPVILLAGKVLDKKTNLPVEAEINYESLSDNSEEGIAKTSPIDGTYKIVIPAGKIYGFWPRQKDTFRFLTMKTSLPLMNTWKRKKTCTSLRLKWGRSSSSTTFFSCRARPKCCRSLPLSWNGSIHC